jgi:hypothetical protein
LAKIWPKIYKSVVNKIIPFKKNPGNLPGVDIILHFYGYMISKKAHSEPQEIPPIFKRWSTLYIIVLVSHVLVIALFTWLTLLF